MISIRKYEEKDYENVCYACLNSEGDDDITEEFADFVLNTFCKYYIDNEPENCFVVDDEGKAVGYIICAENFDKFKKTYDEEYFPRSIKYGESRIEWATEAYMLHEKYKDIYPAHLHIDILPEYQRMGVGGKLLRALFDHLLSKDIKGVMLTCGTNNVTANNFYKKYGFEELEVVGTDIAYGKKLV